MCSFADYTTLYSCNQSIDIVISEVEHTVARILTWFDSSWKKVDNDFHLFVNGKIAPEKDQVKILGVPIHSNPNFNLLIKEICGMVNQKTSVFARL